MIKKIIIVLIVFSSCGVNQKLIKNKDLSSIIYKSQCRCSKRKDAKYFFNARKQVENRLDFINYDIDTVFVLQTDDSESGKIYESIWTKYGKFEYDYYFGEISNIGKPNYMKRLYKLIENWDIETLKREEKEYRVMAGCMPVFGMRIIIKKQKVESSCIIFDDFFNPAIDLTPNYEPEPDKD